MFPLKNTTANKRCMLLEKWQVSFFGRYSVGWECRECLLKFMIPKLQEMPFNSTLQRIGMCSFCYCAASVLQVFPKESNRGGTVLPSPTNSSRKYFIKSPQGLSLFQPSFGKKNHLWTFDLMHRAVTSNSSIIPNCRAAPTASRGRSDTS